MPTISVDKEVYVFLLKIQKSLKLERHNFRMYNVVRSAMCWEHRNCRLCEMARRKENRGEEKEKK